MLPVVGWQSVLWPAAQDSDEGALRTNAGGNLLQSRYNNAPISRSLRNLEEVTFFSSSRVNDGGRCARAGWAKFDFGVQASGECLDDAGAETHMLRAVCRTGQPADAVIGDCH